MAVIARPQLPEDDIITALEIGVALDKLCIHINICDRSLADLSPWIRFEFHGYIVRYSQGYELRTLPQHFLLCTNPTLRNALSDTYYQGYSLYPPEYVRSGTN